MAVRAYVFVAVTPGMEEEVQRTLANYRDRGITSAEIIVCPHQMIVQVEAPNFSSIGRLVLREIHGVPGVENTITCPVVEPAL